MHPTLGALGEQLCFVRMLRAIESQAPRIHTCGGVYHTPTATDRAMYCAGLFLFFHRGPPLMCSLF